RVLPRFFGSNRLRLVSVNVSYHQLTIVAIAAIVAVLLRLFFYRTRIGIAMRAVVDDPDLAAMNAVEPARVAQLRWALGATLAALAGILVAPLVNLDALTLTLLIVDAFAAAMVGRLKSLPLTCVGALGLGLINAYGVGYMPQTDFVNRFRLGLPTIFLFVVLLVMPARRLRAGRAVARRLPSPPRLPTAAVTAAGFALLIAVFASVLSIDNQIHLGEALAFGFIMLSLVLLTGYGG